MSTKHISRTKDVESCFTKKEMKEKPCESSSQNTGMCNAFDKSLQCIEITREWLSFSENRFRQYTVGRHFKQQLMQNTKQSFIIIQK